MVGRKFYSVYEERLYLGNTIHQKRVGIPEIFVLEDSAKRSTGSSLFRSTLLPVVSRSTGPPTPRVWTGLTEVMRQGVLPSSRSLY